MGFAAGVGAGVLMAAFFARVRFPRRYGVRPVGIDPFFHIRPTRWPPGLSYLWRRIVYWIRYGVDGYELAVMNLRSMRELRAAIDDLRSAMKAADVTVVR